MSAVVSSLSLASAGTSRWVVSLTLGEREVLVSHVGILAIIKRRIDGTSQCSRTTEPIDWVGRAGFIVAYFHVSSHPGIIIVKAYHSSQ